VKVPQKAANPLN
jgi:hypothetical protein